MPVTSHKFGSIDPITEHEIVDDNGQFVSSVCWRQNSNMVVAANSSGRIKLLQLVWNKAQSVFIHPEPDFIPCKFLHQLAVTKIYLYVFLGRTMTDYRNLTDWRQRRGTEFTWSPQLHIVSVCVGFMAFKKLIKSIEFSDSSSRTLWISGLMLILQKWIDSFQFPMLHLFNWEKSELARIWLHVCMTENNQGSMVAKIMFVTEAWSQPFSTSSPPNQADTRCKMDELVVMIAS